MGVLQFEVQHMKKLLIIAPQDGGLVNCQYRALVNGESNAQNGTVTTHGSTAAT